jgi:hypothetical protein
MHLRHLARPRTIVSVACVGLLGATPTLNGRYAVGGETVAALRAALVQWHSSATFRSTYVLREGQTKTLEKAFSNDPIENLKSSSSGTYSKMGDLARYSRTYSTPAYVTRMLDAKGEDVAFKDGPSTIGTPPGGRAFVRFLPIDEACSADIDVAYQHSWKDIAAVAHVKAMASMPADSFGRRCTRTGQFVAPLQPASGCYPGFPWEPAGGIDDKVFVVKKPDSSHLQLNAKCPPNAHGDEHEMSIEWWTEPPIPVITRIIRVTKSRNKVARCESRLSDFKNCDGVFIGRHLTAVMGDEESGYLVWDWLSRDLGDQPPSPEDFVIPIEPDTLVFGLKGPARGKIRSISVSSLRLPDLTPPIGQLVVNPTTSLAVSGASSERWWLIIALNSALLVGVLIFVARHRRKRAS